MAFFPEIVQTFTRLSVEHNYEVLLSSLPDDSQMLEAAARQMIGRRVDGVAILTFGREELLIDVFRGRNIPLFVADVDSPGASVKTVRIDYEHGIWQAVQHLAGSGPQPNRTCQWTGQSQNCGCAKSSISRICD